MDKPEPPSTLTLANWKVGIISCSPEKTVQLAAELARLLPENTALALHGDLGAGKTTFVRGLAQALGIQNPITSPTYSIFSIYESPSRQLVHMDAFRLTSPQDADTLVLWDLLRIPWTLAVEWPEKLGDRLPDGAWYLDFVIQSEGKHLIRLR